MKVSERVICSEEFPERLFDCVINFANKSDGKKGRFKHTIFKDLLPVKEADNGVP